MIEFWSAKIEARQRFWFRWPFWFIFFAPLVLLAIVQIPMAATDAGRLWWLLSAANLVIGFALGAMFLALGEIGFRQFRNELFSIDFIKTFFDPQWKRVEYIESSLRKLVADNRLPEAREQMGKFVDELIAEPLPERIFGIFARRLIALIVIVPVFGALALMIAGERPAEHSFVKERYSWARSMAHGSAAIRDITTTLLGGSNTEHPLTEGEAQLDESAPPAASAAKAIIVTPAAPLQQRRTAQPAPPGAAAKRLARNVWRGLVWELVCLVGIVYYLFIIVSFVPMQLGSMQTVLRRFAAPEFWARYFTRSVGL